MSVAPGTVVGGDFVVEGPLASGGMGTVYIAQQRSTGRPRALKVMHHKLAKDPVLRERFVRESRVAANLRSTHVVEVIAAGVTEEDDAPWIAMEYLGGETLYDLINGKGALPLEKARVFMQQMCHGLAEAHAQGIVHRDLKPHNIFVVDASHSTQPLLKLLDFGIAKVLIDATGDVTAAIGSPAWMAPEQTSRSDQIRPPTDVWALGLLAFFMITGRPYWRSLSQGGGVMGVMRELIQEPLVPGSVRSREIGATRFPEALDDWLAGCLAREPTQRYLEAGATGRAFEAAASQARAAAGDPIALGGSGVSPPLTNGPRPSDLASAMSPHPAPPTLPTNGASWIPAAPPPQRAPVAAAPPGAPPRPKKRWPWVVGLVAAACVVGTGIGLGAAWWGGKGDSAQRSAPAKRKPGTVGKAAISKAQRELAAARAALEKQDYLEAKTQARWAQYTLNQNGLEPDPDRRGPSSGSAAMDTAAEVAIVLIEVKDGFNDTEQFLTLYPGTSPSTLRELSAVRSTARKMTMEEITYELDPWLDDGWRACARIVYFSEALHVAEQIQRDLKRGAFDHPQLVETSFLPGELEAVQDTLDTLATVEEPPGCAKRAKSFVARALELDGIVPGRARSR